MNNPSGGIFPFRSGRTRSSRRSCSRCPAPVSGCVHRRGATGRDFCTRAMEAASRAAAARSSEAGGPQPPTGPPTIPGNRLDNHPPLSPGCASGISTARDHETAGRRSRRQLETACRPRRRSPGPHPPLPLVAGLQSSGGICLVYTRGNPKNPAASLQPCNPAKRGRTGCTSKGRISFD